MSKKKTLFSLENEIIQRTLSSSIIKRKLCKKERTLSAIKQWNIFHTLVRDFILTLITFSCINYLGFFRRIRNRSSFRSVLLEELDKYSMVDDSFQIALGGDLSGGEMLRQLKRIIQYIGFNCNLLLSSWYLYLLEVVLAVVQKQT